MRFEIDACCTVRDAMGHPWLLVLAPAELTELGQFLAAAHWLAPLARSAVAVGKLAGPETPDPGAWGIAPYEPDQQATDLPLLDLAELPWAARALPWLAPTHRTGSELWPGSE